MAYNTPQTPDDTEYSFIQPPSSISCMAGSEEMFRVGPDGFWVRGTKVPQDEHEAQAVYQAFKEFLTWAQLTRPY